MASASDESLRSRIIGLLTSGLATDVYPRADSHEQVQRLVCDLRLAGDDLEAKLKLAGFTSYPIEHAGITQLCETCMYYKVHQRFCELPELNVPVEPDWSCKLWRI
ncbi:MULTISPECIES: hypothetical protein [Bradyrhizobium]|uniref:Uncharacterized protein n=3 Tax=Bradyrhizobium TaxID=374 RepID=A0A410VIL8_9BRAD|nr:MULTISPECIES: hypothetical protein [Bradyrhizobium]MCG2628126.1 hypothetical protein [Bradyrhizobium zhengyangense]MCG2643245.1 hypothetical protein [Bradyrhizobium zhengyangense]MCG2670441.1 hypothetical protein [Bradyrhizobium zhengyangense]MDN4985824.1 hypothetical protein [Bradyrhizobium sp. WYCCWR 13022]MDN5002797.1 hypothetical protein [Bradyrhizobium sp. WYCCWR 12677]